MQKQVTFWASKPTAQNQYKVDIRTGKVYYSSKNLNWTPLRSKDFYHRSFLETNHFSNAEKQAILIEIVLERKSILIEQKLNSLIYS